MSIREPDKFTLIYRCKIKDTGEKVYKIPSVAYPLLPIDPAQVVTHESQPIIAIEMPYEEYERFRNHWETHLDIIKEAKENPIIREQYEKLLILIQLYK